MAEHIHTEGPRPVTGLAAIAVAIGFNVPFAILGATFEYPDVLRRPAGEVLELFAQGGAPLTLTWHAFALSALALAPLAFALTLTRKRVRGAGLGDWRGRRWCALRDGAGDRLVSLGVRRSCTRACA